MEKLADLVYLHRLFSGNQYNKMGLNEQTRIIEKLIEIELGRLKP
jgi:hypothetical protein